MALAQLRSTWNLDTLKPGVVQQGEINLSRRKFSHDIVINIEPSSIFAYRMVPWGRPMCASGLLYLKAIGIRVHTVRYQKIRKQIDRQVNDSSDHMDETWQSSKEFKRLRGK